MARRDALEAAANFVRLGLAALLLAGCPDETVTGTQDATDVGPLSDADVTDTLEVTPDVSDGQAADAEPDVPVEDVEEELPPPTCEGGCCTFGASCASDGECCSGYCIDSELGSLCTKECELSCPKDWACKGVTDVGADVVFLCVPDDNRLCEPCAGDLACDGGLCLTLDGVQACTKPCETSADCPGDFTCEERASEDDPELTSKQCVPTAGACDCTSLSVGAARPCAADNEFGSCEGQQTCETVDAATGAADWGSCTAATPAAEICDGLDNDCDGFADESPAQPEEACTVDNEFGSCGGVWVCEGADGWSCVAATAEAEVCDLQDNDCDGEIDEDFKDDAGLYATDAHCGVCGNDCATLLPNATNACVVTGGAAKCEVVTCDPGFYKVSATTCLPVQDPSCVPCTQDADCLIPGNKCLPLDGGNFCARDCAAGNVYETDEGVCPTGFVCQTVGSGELQCLPEVGSCTCLTGEDAGATRPCVDANAEGTCTGLQTCDPATGWSACTAKQPATEECNGVDDDCDGLVDEGVAEPTDPCEVTNGFGTCTGAWSCKGAAGWQCGAATPAAEVCDAKDNDCDGAADEDFKDEATGLYDADEHCGVCGKACANLFPNATAACSVASGAAQCQVTACGAGYYQVSATTCLPVQDVACVPCTEDANCVVPGNVCVAVDGGSFCGRDCADGNLYGTPAGECPSGYTCADLGAGVMQCLPDTGSCSCLDAGDEGGTRPCAVSNAVGTCTGTQACAADGWSACSAPEPADEVCNGGDDDCDGNVDEGVTEPAAACEVTNGFGTCSGDWSCGGAAGWVCDAATPVAETCNGADDDCDGTADEDFKDAATGLYAADEHCGLCGNTCDGAILFATGTACEIQAGQAVCVATECEPGFVIPATTNRLCVPESGAANCAPCTEDSQCQALNGGLCEAIDGGTYCTASCTDAVDCGAGYDCLAGRCRPQTGSCTCLAAGQDGKIRICSSANAFGTCVGSQTCDSAVGWSACSATIPAAETCDGLDNDCDGVVDEGVTKSPPDCAVTNGFGTCGGVYVCQGTAGWKCTAATPQQDVCDLQDNNCDGVADEPFKNGAGLYVDDANCGACGIDCATAIPNADAACSDNGGSPRCEVVTCDAGFYQAGPLTCLPVQDSLCTPCVTDANCPTPGDRCLSGLDGGGHCGRDCSAGNVHGLPEGQCPTGYACVDYGGGDMQCTPASASCSCLPGDDGATRPCSASNGEGTCFGAQTCDPATGWSSCSAATPAAEICNVNDDDCNGVVDDVAGRGGSCTNDNGFGSCPGVLDCVGGETALQCVGATPAAELCDGLDNDCDGETDEDFADLLTSCSVGVGACARVGVVKCTADGSGTECSASPGTGAAETCNGIDDDCNGTVDDGPLWANKGQPCSVGQGACTEVGVYVCDAGDPAAATVCDATPSAAGTETCNGLDDDCTGVADDNLTAPACALTAGVCAGKTQACGGASGFQPCTPTQYGAGFEPNEVSCDGLDNDCDGAPDNDLPAVPCANQQGVCAGSLKVCAGSLGFQDCGPSEFGGNYEATEATCDYLDNDCDGQTDEVYKTGGKYTDQDHCGFCGNSCTGAIVNGTGTCDGSLATPKCVVATCDPGYVQVGAAQCLPASLGLCDPCVDATNCQLPGAACVTLDDGGFCLNPCVDDTTCPSGYSCVDQGGTSVCTPDTNACICNGGNVGLTKGCAVDGPGYQCFGTEQCTAGGWTGCALPAETCNLVDDNCDGQVDEGFTNGSGAYVSDEHCGACGNDCTGLNFPGTVGSCDDTVDPPTCQVTCTGTCFDVNGNPADGCECCDPDPTDFPDLGGADDNCDGIDGEVANGIFVAKNGDDANPGTLAAPKLTIEAGIAAADAGGKRDVYVATGVYVEQVVLVEGVAVYGGYSSDFDVRSVVLYETAIVSPDPASGVPGGVTCTDISGGAPGATRLDGFSVFGHQEKDPAESSYAVYLRNCDDSVAITNNRVFGGSGGKGARGGDGTNGASGAAGGAGTPALDLYEAYGVTDHNCTSANHSPGGAGGTFSCGGASVAGGSGGNRVCPFYDGSVTTTPVASEAGTSGSNGGGAGGEAGRDVYHQAFQCLGYETFPGRIEGEDGDDGANGTNGTAGLGCTDVDGTVVAGLFEPGIGSQGGVGGHGGGGGGGGSGGGAWSHNSCNAKGFNFDNLGGTGGGGGSGACGATAGTPGTSGGGAFSVFVTFDATAGTVPTIDGNTIGRGFGGTGGDGGAGGVGGNGGAGALGGVGGGGFDPPIPTYPSFAGGKGGNGGNGGHGGGGGGGCGGPAYGVYAHGTGAADLSAWAAGNTFVGGGAGGSGGLGGFSLGNPGGDGSLGAALDTNF